MKNCRRCLFALLMLLVIKLGTTYVIGLYWVPTGSMEPTIKTGSLCLGWRLPYVIGEPKPHRGEIVIFRDATTETCCIKRVIGLPGESISFVNGLTFVDDKQLDESYLPEQGHTYAIRDKQYVIPDGCIYVMGDNREHSADSRSLNPYIPIANIQARWLM